MEGLAQLWNAADGVGRGTAVLLLAMSIAAWALIVWKTWLLRRAAADLARALPAFWDAPSRADARARLQALDRERLLLPLLAAAEAEPAAATLEAAARPESQRTRRLRGALLAAQAQLRSGQVSLDQVSGPVGEALVMTAAGIAVAVPAVLAYNLFGSWIADREAELEGFAHDLLEL